VAVLLSAIFIGGLFLDGWAHNHGRVDQSFFTPWHAVLYSGYALNGLFLLVMWWRNRRAGHAWRSALPQGYGLALLGAAIFAVGGVLDLIWHTLFGIEADVQALLSPTHLLLASGLFLMLTGPLRANWLRMRDERALSWGTGAPVVLALALVLSMLAFFTQFAHPLVQPWAASDPRTRQVHGDLYVMRADGSGQLRLTTTQLDASSPSWSPDGTRIAFQSAVDKTNAIYEMRADGTDVRRLTAAGVDSFEPAWSPDGARIAYVAFVAGTGRVMLMNANGTGARQVTEASSSAFGPAWSPDGQQLVFESNRSGSFNLYHVSVNGGKTIQLTRTSGADDFQPAWSPNGRQIAFTSNREGAAQVYLMNADGSGQRRLTTSSGASARVHAESFAPAWSPDGASIAFTSTRDGSAQVYVTHADGSHPVNVSQNSGMDDGVGNIAWSSTGELAYGAVGHPTIDAEATTALGIAGILLQAALFMGVLLFALRRWALPPGAATVMLTLSAILISFMADEFRLIPVAFLAGVVADVALVVLRPGPERPGALRAVAFGVPVVYFLLYFAVLQLTGGVGWVIHLWAGAPFMAGVLGLFLSYLVVPPGMGKTLAGRPAA
jgi:Tol biopolymer transport system component